MRCRWSAGAMALPLVLLAACAPAGGPAQQAKPAPLFEGLGDHRFAITTASAEAQRYFDQGLMLAYGFNHAEAERSFRAAAGIDPACAICWWGAALVLGPNINAPMEPDAAPRAFEAVSRAVELAPGASERERAYINALAKRYAAAPPEDRAPLDQAYADAMREVARRFPDDIDAQALFAEAAMDLHPWNYWTVEGDPQPWTPEIIATLEAALKTDPDHPGAIHFYIHAVEASPTPERAAPYAERLGRLVPGAGHLVHMPSHIFMRMGRYHDASESNRAAERSDDAYVTQCHAQGVYPLAYIPHAVHFLWQSAAMEGDSAEAIRAARGTDHRTAHDRMRDPGLGTLQHYAVTPLFAMVRFGRWAEILESPAPPGDLVYPNGIRHYARGMALASTGRLDEAAAELEAARKVAADPGLEKVTIWDINPTTTLMRIAVAVLAGEIAGRRGKPDEAVAQLREAVRLEDSLRYNEPPDWPNPARHNLGAVLIQAGRAREAEAVYREDLQHNRENGWALFGLAQSLEAQKRAAEAAAARRRFAAAWTGADVTLTASRF